MAGVSQRASAQLSCILDERLSSVAQAGRESSSRGNAGSMDKRAIVSRVFMFNCDGCAR